jgi:manganese/iron transport system ATP-binding protein
MVADPIGSRRPESTPCCGHEAATAAVEFDSVSFAYDDRPVLQGVTFSLPAGSCLALVGPNGSGKSTLLKMLVGQVQPQQGQVRVFGAAPNPRRHLVGYVPQVHRFDRHFPISVYEVVMLGRAGRIGLLRRPKAADRERVMLELERVGMADLANRPIGDLSGGQQQRVFIARALAQEARILLLDEPVNGLDLPAQQGIYDLLERLHSTGVTTITSTHDHGALELHRFGSLLLLNKRVVAFGATRELMQSDAMARTFGVTGGLVNGLVN